MKGFATGNESALQEAMSLHGTALLSFLYRCTGDRAGSDDLYQETWLRAYRNRRGYDASRPLRNWLYAIALNLVRTQRRKGARRREVEREARPLAADSAGAPAPEEIREFLNRLPDDQRETFVLREMQGLTYEEIAEVTGRPVGTLKSQMFHAIRKLRSMLEPLWTAPK
jgi:RNA polymerase sigma-70 factor (ECF subfamily)